MSSSLATKKADRPKLRSPLKWHGGKTYLARRIIALFPPHTTYIEPFFGGGSILLNKAPAEREFAGDAYGNLIAFWTDLQRRHETLIPEWRGLKYRKTTFDAHAFSATEPPSTTAFLVRNRMSRSGHGKDFAWSDRLRGGQPGDANAWERYMEEMLPKVVDRIRGVRFVRADALALIREHDAPGTLTYCDPPYLHETRTHTKAYRHEMTDEGHRELLDLLVDCRGAVLVSGYRSTLYDRMLSDWTRHEIDMPNHSGQGKSKERRIECVWAKP